MDPILASRHCSKPDFDSEMKCKKVLVELSSMQYLAGV